MTIMLPSLNSAHLSLADVLPSCLSSLGMGHLPNSLSLTSAQSAVVVLIDGLGVHNLSSASAHARFLSRALSAGTPLRTVFPSTTAAALASLTTGATPGSHGMTGYRVRNPETGEVLNSLSGLGAVDEPSRWLLREPLYLDAARQGITSTVVAHPRFSDTPLTRIIHRGAEQHSAKSLDERVEAVLSVLTQPGKHLVILYISELDELAHNKGVSSAEWAESLESVDAALKSLSEALPMNTGMFVTADHGVLDIPATHHYLYGLDAEHITHISAVGGEPRCLQLYFSESSTKEERERTLASWREDWSHLAWVLTRDEVIQAGMYGDVDAAASPRLGDIFVLAHKDVVFYDERDQALTGRNMIGQHGGISERELSIPGIRLGAFAR